MLTRALRTFGKTGSRVVAVFTLDAAEADTAVAHLLRGKVGFPVHLFCLAEPGNQTRAACAVVCVEPNPLRLAATALRLLWPYWIALGVAPWTGKRMGWPLKIVPFLLPPFRPLVMNENRDFFAPSAGSVSNHVRLRMVRVARAWPGRYSHVARGLLALPFAWAAQQFSPLSRYVFARIRARGGTDVLRLWTIPEYDSGVAIYEYQEREWDREAIQAFLKSTQSRWISFCKKGHSEDVDDLLALFSRENTFAVSRQEGTGNWQSFILPTTCPRALQQDEAAQVFAPISGTLLVDRAKLMALGLPNQSGYGSSWYLLFWKAAAAGWRSYSVGAARGPLPPLPGAPFYEAQFVHTLLLEPALARLRPRDEDLARGGIAQRNSGGLPFRGYPRVLVLSPYLPFPLSHGGAVRMYHLCRALEPEVDFVLVCFREKGDTTDYGILHGMFREVYVVTTDEKHVADGKLPAQVNGYESRAMRALVADVCSHARIDLLQIEYTQMAAYREAAPLTPAILVEHDITFTLHRQLAGLTPGGAAEREYRKWRAFESERLSVFDAVWTMSEHDRDQAMEAGSRPDATVVVPNGVDLKRFAPQEKEGAEREILYVGSFRHRPNFLGFQELRGTIMPAVWRRFPDARLVVVAGPDHETYWEGERSVDPRIRVHGFVNDVAPFYRSCDVVAVPLPVSAGTNIKVMEALACERAVVSTPVGCIGLGLQDGVDIRVAALGEDFAAAITGLLADAGMRRAMARAGRKTAEEKFGWDRIARTARKNYADLLSGRWAGDRPA